MTLSHRAISRVTACVIIALIVIAAGGAYYFYYQTSQQPPRAKTSFTYGILYDFTTLDPSTEYDVNNVLLNSLYDQLVWYNSTSGKVLPGLATSWESSENATSWIFHLRKDVRFHDGTPFNATAVKYSINRTMSLGEGAAYIWSAVKEINVLDDYTVQFKLKYPAALDVIATATYGTGIMSPSAVNTPQWFNAGNESGSGPYRLTRYDPSGTAVLEKYTDWWGWREPGYLRASPDAPDIFIVKVVRDAVAMENQVVTGGLDMVSSVPLEDITALQQNPKVQVYEYHSFRNLNFEFNTRRAPLNNTLVRLAIAHAIDYNAVVTVALGGHGRVASGPLPYGYPGHSEDFRYDYNLTEARALLAEAGYPNGGFRLTLPYTTGDSAQKKAVEVISANLKQLGIELDLYAMTFSDKWSVAQTGWQTPQPANVQDIFVSSWWPTYITPYDFLQGMYHDSGNSFDCSYFSDPTFENLIDTALTLEGSNYDKALQLYHQAQEILYEKVPGIALYDISEFLVARQGIANLAQAVDPDYEGVMFPQMLSIKASTSQSVAGFIWALADIARQQASFPRLTWS
jgi:peptide/nickel transport system substrate-binding protein